MGRRSLPLAVIAASTASVLAAVGAAGPVRAREAARSETPVASGSPVTDVSESVVRVKVPLPASAGPHPAHKKQRNSSGDFAYRGSLVL